MASASSAQQQLNGKDIIIFGDFEGMSTQVDRHALPEKKLAWLENLQPIGPNNLLSVGIPDDILATLTGETITKQFYFQKGQSSDYVINFTQSGAAYAVSNPGGAITTIATAGTFSSEPDVTQWGTERILIADATAGYCTWDGSVLVKQGGVSPNITVTNGGSGYTSAPAVSITGGTGSGATATATVTGGVVTSITLTNPGTGYLAGDTLTVGFSGGGGGSGATAIAHVWPFISPKPTTLAVYQGRVWLAQTNVITYTGTGATYGGVGYDDFLSADASGSITINDPDLTHAVYALRSINNYLYILGDNSVKQIGNITVSGSTTAFTLVTLSSDQGTIYRDTIVSYNRLLVFANTVGIYAVFGSSVEKISDDMDGIFRNIDFSQKPCASVNDINNIHVLLLLVKYVDPELGSRSIILSFMSKKWFVISQGDDLKFIVTAIISGMTETFGTSGDDVRKIIADYDSPIDILVKTALSPHGKAWLGKSTTRYAVAQVVGGTNDLTLTIESERLTQAIDYSASGQVVTWLNNSGDEVSWINNSMVTVEWIGNNAFTYQTGQATVAGVYIGCTLEGTVQDYALNTIMLEYKDGSVFGSSR